MTAVGLAVGPNIRGEYDPTLAVLTATLVAVIWYTYFTYKSVNAHVPTVIRPSLSGQAYANTATLEVSIINDSPNHATARIALEAWVDDESIPLDMLHSAQVDVALEPRQAFSRPLHLDGQSFPSPTESPYGESLPNYSLLRCRLQVFWRDQYGEEGVAGPLHYVARIIGDSRLKAVVAPPDIHEYFGALGTALPRPKAFR